MLVFSDILPLDTLVLVLTVPLLTRTLWLRPRVCRGVVEGGGVTREWRREAA